MLEVLAEFPGLPHRMQFVARMDDVDFVNDSKATNVDAAIAAVNSVEGRVVLIAGGDGKGGDFAALAAAVEPKLAGAVLIGRDAEAIGEALDANGDRQPQTSGLASFSGHPRGDSTLPS